MMRTQAIEERFEGGLSYHDLVVLSIAMSSQKVERDTEIEAVEHELHRLCLSYDLTS